MFVVTHFEREPLKLDGGTTFTFVTTGVQDALAQARRAAGGKDIHLGGGANIAQQFLAENLIDEMEINMVPIFLGSGERLFDGMNSCNNSNLRGLLLVRMSLTFATARCGNRMAQTFS